MKKYRLPKQLMKSAGIKKGLPFKVYPSNSDYLKLKHLIYKSQEYFNEDEKFVKIESGKTISELDYMLYESESTMVFTGDGSHLKFKSRANSVDLNRVWVVPENHGHGIGTGLMDYFMSSVIEFVGEENRLPKVILECLGQVGGGDNRQKMPVEKQVKFFEKFGFEVVRIKDGYHHMELTEKGFLEYYENRLEKILQLQNS